MVSLNAKILKDVVVQVDVLDCKVPIGCYSMERKGRPRYRCLDVLKYRHNVEATLSIINSDNAG